jgi:hypothetical protein
LAPYTRTTSDHRGSCEFHREPGYDTGSLAFGKNTDLWVVNSRADRPVAPGPAVLMVDAGVKGSRCRSELKRCGPYDRSREVRPAS